MHVHVAADVVDLDMAVMTHDVEVSTNSLLVAERADQVGADFLVVTPAKLVVTKLPWGG